MTFCSEDEDSFGGDQDYASYPHEGKLLVKYIFDQVQR